MTHRIAVSTLFAAAVAAGLAGTVSAQIRVGQDGRLTEASPQIGTGGYNQGLPRAVPPGYMNRPNGNQIVTGNVTGGREFRGNVPYTDPQAFRGNTAGQRSDAFIRGSVGAPTRGDPNANMTNRTPQSFFGASRTVQAPQGFSRDPLGGAFVATPAPKPRQVGDARLGAVTATGQPVIPSVSQARLPGQVDPAWQRASGMGFPPAMPTASGRGPASAARTSTTAFVDPVYAAMQRQQVSYGDLTRMRDEITAADASTDKPDASPDAAGVTGQSVTGQAISSAVEGASMGPTALSNTPGVDQSVRSRLLVPAAEQSSQYAEMVRRYEKESAGLTDAQANVLLQQQLRAQQEARQQTPSVIPGADTAPPDVAPPADEPGDSAGGVLPSEQLPAPPLDLPVVRSLAEGVKAKGLAEQLTVAETAMREGRFADAIDRFDVAAQVADNNPLVAMGHAFAELGASYYGQAESSLRQTIADHPEVLMAKYDLTAMFGQQRYDFLVNDLKTIANSEAAEARPMFLLGYMAFNAGDRERAILWLDDAERRGGPDATIKLMRQLWSLPAPLTDSK